MNYSNEIFPPDSSNSISKSLRPFNANEVKQMLERLVPQTIDRQNEYDCNKCTQLSKDLSTNN